jgi:hypothetical protein
MNKNLTASNEKAVLRLVQDTEAKGRWQSVASVRGKAAADTYISNLRCQSLKTVKAARYYWN